MYEFGCKITLVFSDLYVIFRQSFVIFRQIQIFFTSKSPKTPISSRNGVFHKKEKAPCGGEYFWKVNYQESSKLQSDIRREEISML